MKANGDSVGAFAGWCVIGATACFGVLAVFTIGPFLLLLTMVLSGLMLWRFDPAWGMAGMLSGAGLPVLFVAWLNRGGPGEVCTRTATEVSCTDEWSPWPLLAVGVLLLVGGVALFAARRGR